MDRLEAMRTIAELEGELRWHDKLGDQPRVTQLRADIARRKRLLLEVKKDDGEG
jgi:hypothetical protein